MLQAGKVHRLDSVESMLGQPAPIPIDALSIPYDGSDMLEDQERLRAVLRDPKGRLEFKWRSSAVHEGLFAVPAIHDRR
jgi:hypothetical protein